MLGASAGRQAAHLQVRVPQVSAPPTLPHQGHAEGSAHLLQGSNSHSNNNSENCTSLPCMLRKPWEKKDSVPKRATHTVQGRAGE